MDDTKRIITPATWSIKSDAGDGFVAILATFGGRTAILTGRFNFQHWVSC